MARKMKGLLQPAAQTEGERPHSLRSVATADLIQVLREYETERKSRTRLITVRSNLMGQALQIPFAPVCHPATDTSIQVARLILLATLNDFWSLEAVD